MANFEKGPEIFLQQVRFIFESCQSDNIHELRKDDIVYHIDNSLRTLLELAGQ